MALTKLRISATSVRSLRARSAADQGIASALLDGLPDAERYVVATGAANAPARALYVRRGFTLVRERTVADGVRIVEFALLRNRA
jgi:hypothetical protein